MSMKIPLTPTGIEPDNFRFVAQHLNHCDTAVPTLLTVGNEFKGEFVFVRFLHLFFRSGGLNVSKFSIFP